MAVNGGEGGVRIRRVRTDEAGAFREIRLRALADTPLAFGSTRAREAAYPPERWEARARESADGPAQATFLALDPADEAPVGLAFAVIDRDDATLARSSRCRWRPRRAAAAPAAGSCRRSSSGPRHTARARCEPP